MDHISKHQEINLHRLGFHYFLDAERYKHADAQMWIRKLQKLSADWLVLNNPKERAIPEEFIRLAKKRKINIIINFNQHIKDFKDFSSIKTLLNVYGKWGVKYACFFSVPNERNSWGEKKWNSNDIVQKHADLFQQFARICIENNIQPIFSTLQPGGDYQDLAFLEKSLQILKKSADPYLIKKMVLSAFGWHWNHPLDWGAGGKAQWPKAKLFGMPVNSENHIGFRTYQWYLDISKKIIGKKMPIIIFEAGRQNNHKNTKSQNPTLNPNDIKAIVDLLHGKNVFKMQDPEKLLAPIPNEVIACCFYLLSAEKEKNCLPYRWFTAEGKLLPPAKMTLGKENDKPIFFKTEENNLENNNFKYQRYIYITESLKQKIPVLLEQLDPYIKKYKPHIGFSIIEASHAAYLLVITDSNEDFLNSQAEILPEGNILKIISPDEIQELMKV